MNIKEALKKKIKLKISPGMLAPRDYVRSFIDQNGISQREFNRLVGSFSTGFTNQILSGKTTISSTMADSIGKVLFESKEDMADFKSLVIIDKTELKENPKYKAFSAIVKRS